MRSHAKAATAGTTQRQASSLGGILRAAFATRGVSGNPEGSDAPKAGRFARRLCLLVVLSSLTMGLGASSAFAANGVVDFFGNPDDVFSGSLGGEFASSSGGPGGVALNQAGTGGAGAGDVYVVDRGNHRIQQFEADGSWVRAFGKDVEGAGIDVCEAAANCVQAANNAEAGALNSPQGVAIDQATGNLYVTDQGNRRIDVFSAEGEFQGAFGWGVDTGVEELQFCTTASGCQSGSTGAGAGQFGTQVGYPAVAPTGSPNAGHLYVADKANRRVDEFEPVLTAEDVTGIAFVKAWGWGVDSGAAEFQQCTAASLCQSPNTSSPTSNPGQFSFNQPQALAVDSSGNIYTAESAGNSRAQKFDPSGNPAAFSANELNGSPGPQDIAVDPTSDRVYAIKDVSGERRVLEFNAAGAMLKTHASGTGISSANGLAQIHATEDFYMTTSGAARGVFVLGTKVAPTASVEAPDPLTAHSATLKGRVNPTGFTTAYRFEFSKDGGSSWENVPASDVDLGDGEAEEPVSQEVTGLIGGQSYRYRIVATKPFGAGTATSSQQVFTTPASAPTIPATFVSAVTTTTAVLEAEINPNNQATTYRFEYGLEDCAVNPCTSIPIPDAGIGSGGEPVSVAKEITGLTPDTTYHFRVVATNATGTVEGADTTFNTYELFVPRTDCPNQTLRHGPSANLPDCRAYEMVSPVDKDGGEIRAQISLQNSRIQHMQSAVDGDKITYSSMFAFGDQPSGAFINQYIASRGADGWSTRGVNAPIGQSVNDPFFSPPETSFIWHAFNPDLSSGWVTSFNKEALPGSGGLDGDINLYRRDSGEGTFEALTNAGPFGPADLEGGGKGMKFQGATGDLSHQIFTVAAALTPDAAANVKNQLYDLSGGQLELVSVLPNGEADPNHSYAGQLGSWGSHGQSNVDHAISADGSRIFWTSETNTDGDRLYVRIDGETTVPVSESVTSDSAQYWTAAVDGSKAVFSVGGLQNSQANLYRFDVDSETSTLVAGEVSGVAGASDDASRIYFASREALAAGASVGEHNLYLDDEGVKTLVATLSSTDLSFAYNPVHLWPRNRASRVTSDGRHFAFFSNKGLTGYDNTDAVTGEADGEVFLYDAGSKQLTCVSCNPSGARPVGRKIPPPYAYPESAFKTDIAAAAWISTWETELNESHVLSDDGSRLFFNSYDALLPQDTNGVQDVYQWEAQGAGTCQEAGGCISLISTGESPERSEFIDASADGDDVFFETESSIDPRDPGVIDIYDARVGGGSSRAASPIPCIGDACQSVPPAPNDPTPASAGFRGAGNPPAQRNCGAVGRRAAKFSRRAKRLRRAAQRSSATRRSKQLGKRSARFARKAKRLSKGAKRCRRANRRAAR